MLKYYMQDSYRKYMSNSSPLYSGSPHAFILESLGHFCCDQNYYIMRDNLNSCLVFYTLEGTGYLEYKNQKTLLPPNTCAVINCRNYQYYKAHGSHWDFLWLHFGGATAFDLTDELNEDNIFIGHMEKELFLSHYNHLITDQHQPSRMAPLRISLTIHKLMMHLFTEKFESISQNTDSTLNTAFVYMDNHFAEKITLEELAAQIPMSKYYFIRQFKQLTGITPYRYLCNLRIQKAKKLLTTSKLSISEIAAACGFCDSKNFILNFKKTMHCTPNYFRNNTFPDT